MYQIPAQWAGLNHLALITDDMDTTTRFWHGVLGATLVATIGNEQFRHYFFDVGHAATVAFFEYRGASGESLRQASGGPRPSRHTVRSRVPQSARRGRTAGATPAPPQLRV